MSIYTYRFLPRFFNSELDLSGETFTIEAKKSLGRSVMKDEVGLKRRFFLRKITKISSRAVRNITIEGNGHVRI